MRRFSRRDFLKIAGGLAFAATVPFPRPSVSGMLRSSVAELGFGVVAAVIGDPRGGVFE